MLAVISLKATPALAASDPNAPFITALRTTFGITASDATDSELDDVLNAPLGALVRAAVTAEQLGQQDESSGVSKDVLDLLASEVKDLSGSTDLIHTGIEGVADYLDVFGRLSVVYEIYRTLRGAADFITGYVGAYSEIVGDYDWKTLLAAYKDLRLGEGESSEQAWSDLDTTAGSEDLSGQITQLATLEHTTPDGIHSQLEMYVQADLLASDPSQIDAIRDLVRGLVNEEHQYETSGGAQGGGVALIGQNDQMTVANDGPADISNIALLDAAGNQLGTSDDIPSRSSALVDLSTDQANVATISFDVNGVGPVQRPASAVGTPIFFSTPTALPQADPQSYTFTLDDGPHVLNGAAGSYTWQFGDGQSSTTSPAAPVDHTYSCGGPYNIGLTGNTNGHTLTRTTKINIPPPFNVNFTTTPGYDATAPDVPLTFVADPSIPSNQTVTWQFGDGTPPQTGTQVTHTFTTAAVDIVTMSVAPSGPPAAVPPCAPWTDSQDVTVGRSTDWVQLPQRLDHETVLTSAVAGYILTGDTYIPAGETVSIGPGINFKMNAAGGCLLCHPWNLIVRGTLNVNGTAAAPVTFTAADDDSIGGHPPNVYTGFPAGTSPQAGDWNGIEVDPGGNLQLDHADIRYANTGVYAQNIKTGAVDIRNTTIEQTTTGLSAGADARSITVTGSTFHHDATAMSFTDVKTIPTLTGNDIDTATTGIALGTTTATITGTTFTGVRTEIAMSAVASRTTVSGTTVTDGAGFIAISGGVAGGVTTWSADLPYVLTNNVIVPAGATLDLAAGTVTKTYAHYCCADGPLYGFTVSGTLQSQGTAAAPVILTSDLDDTAAGHYAGYTGTSANTSPASGDWRGIAVQPGGSLTATHTEIRYASSGVFTSSSTTPTGAIAVDHSTFTHDTTGMAISGPTGRVSIDTTTVDTATTGYTFTGNAGDFTPQLTNDTITNTATDVQITGAIAATIRTSALLGTQGVISTSTGTTDARGNWWGAASGPQPQGSGAKATGRISYTPWCQSADCVQTPVILANAPPDGAVGQPYDFTFNSLFAPATFAITSGELPPGLHLTDDGELAGTPTAGGQYTFTVTATNPAGTAGGEPYTLSVTQPPAIGVADAPTTLFVGDPIDFQFSSTGYPAPALSIADGQLPSGLQLSPTGELTGTPDQPGDYTFTLRAANSIDTTTQELSIHVAIPSLTAIIVAPATVDLYPGQSQQLTATGVYSDGSTKDITGDVQWTSSAPAIAGIDTGGNLTANNLGDATITAALANASATAQITVHHAAQTITVTADAQTITYGDPDPALTYTVAQSGDEGLTSQPTCSVPDEHTAAGTYTIHCAGASAPYNDKIVYVEGTLTVKPAQLVITPAWQAITYGQPDPNYAYMVTGLRNRDQLLEQPTCAVTSPHHDAGTYPITCTGADAGPNYRLDESATAALTIGRAAVVITPADQSITYGEPSPHLAYTVTGLQPGDSLRTLPTCSVAPDHTHVGSYPITCSGADAGENYKLDQTSTATLTVRKAPLTITAPSPMTTYGTSPATINLQPSITGLVNGDSADDVGLGNVTCTTNATPTGAGSYAAGSYPVTCAATGQTSDYAVSYADGTLTVQQAPLEVVADSLTREYGIRNPALTATISGFVNGDSPTDAYSGTPNLETTATAASDAGSYPITPTAGSLTSANYRFDFNRGTLTITPAPTTITGLTAQTRTGQVTLAASLTTLTQSNPVTQRNITFTGRGGDTLCAATTDASGLATCTATLRPSAIAHGYAAQFDGDIDYEATSAAEDHPSAHP